MTAETLQFAVSCALDQFMKTGADNWDPFLFGRIACNKTSFVHWLMCRGL